MRSGKEWRSVLCVRCTSTQPKVWTVNLQSMWLDTLAVFVPFANTKPMTPCHSRTSRSMSTRVATPMALAVGSNLLFTRELPGCDRPRSHWTVSGIIWFTKFSMSLNANLSLFVWFFYFFYYFVLLQAPPAPLIFRNDLIQKLILYLNVVFCFLLNCPRATYKSPNSFASY